MFEKAKTESSSRSRSGLSKQIARKIDRINYRTPERAFKRYIEGDLEEVEPQEESIKLFCNYLGFKDYEEYVVKNKDLDTIIKGKIIRTASTQTNPNRYIKIVVGIGVTIILVIFVNALIKKTDTRINDSNTCMAWVNDHYEKISCDLNLHPKSGTKIEPLDSKMLTNFRKVEVDRGYRFFINQDPKKPLIWYYKNDKGKMEYYTDPGVHPITGETLKKITKNIIEKYVPIHIYKPDSFISNDEIKD